MYLFLFIAFVLLVSMVIADMLTDDDGWYP